jgi:tetratricopeptide (TPR) repeat protein
MNLMDSTGHRVSGATGRSLAHFEQASRELLCMVDDPAATVDRALTESPDMTMAHVLKAWLHLLGTEPSGVPVALACCEAAARLPADDREERHIAAANALAHGRWREAGLHLEDLSARYPRDTLALQAGHQIDFFRGDSRMLRDRIARALPAWDRTIPGWHAVLGMYSFGLEETGDYAQAEAHGRMSVELEPRDSWAWHAVAHVHEMRNAPREGIAWLSPSRETWSAGSFLGTHNTWHLALFELELDEHEQALRLYDEAVGGTGSSVVLDLIDASAMLWRLRLRGVDVGRRWDSIADRWAAVLAGGGAGQYAFNDVHAMLAYVGADRAAAQGELLKAMEDTARESADNGEFTRDVGLPVARAIQALGAGDAARAVTLLRPVRSQAHRFGGSHAQRDLVDLTLIDAAQRAGDQPLAAALVAERAALRPHSPLAQRLTQRLRVGAQA